MVLVHLSLGSNLYNREYFIREAETQIEKSIGKIIKSSHLYETEPWGTSHPELFLNKVILVKTNLEPVQILEQSQTIEKNLGRILKKEKFSPRAIDIDILFIEQLILNKENLVVPHPYIAERKFILEPFNEIDCEFIHPLLNKTIHQIYRDCNDSHFVRKLI